MLLKALPFDGPDFDLLCTTDLPSFAREALDYLSGIYKSIGIGH
jgi:hypothetical protein